MSYQELKRERDALQVRIKQLEDEILSLRERLLQYEPLRSDHEKPTPPPAMTRLSVSEKVALFRSLFRGREMYLPVDGRTVQMAKVDISLSVKTSGTHNCATSDNTNAVNALTGNSLGSLTMTSIVTLKGKRLIAVM